MGRTYLGWILAIASIVLSGCASTTLTNQNSYTVIGDASFPAELLHANAERYLDDETEVAQPVAGDLWNRIRAGFQLEDIDHPRITRELNWYARHPEYMERVAERARPYLHFIVEEFEKANIPSEIVLLPIVESAFQPFAYSHGRAAGIWQFIPGTGRRFGLEQNWWYDGRRDVYASTMAAIEYLTTLNKQFDGDWMLALAAYNSGSGTVKRAIRRNKRQGKPTDFFSLKLPKETRAYAPKLMALKKLIANPAHYEVSIPSIPDEPYLARVKLDSQIDLAKAAELAEIELDTLYQLNPAYNRWATAPNTTSYLLLPLDNADIFNASIDELPEMQRVKWVRHKIRQGDTLSTIATKYRTTINTIKRVNRLNGNYLRLGHYLTIPVASKQRNQYRLSANQRKKRLQDVPRKGVKIKHIVQPGDTFWDLARQHNVGVRQLAKWNSMAPRDPLTPGTELVIWSRTNKQSSLDSYYELEIPQARTITKRIGYRVRKGDSLHRISQKFRVSISQLKKWNRLPNGNLLRPGQRLTLYVDVTKQSS